VQRLKQAVDLATSRLVVGAVLVEEATQQRDDPATGAHDERAHGALPASGDRCSAMPGTRQDTFRALRYDDDMRAVVLSSLFFVAGACAPAPAPSAPAPSAPAPLAPSVASSPPVLVPQPPASSTAEARLARQAREAAALGTWCLASSCGGVVGIRKYDTAQCEHRLVVAVVDGALTANVAPGAPVAPVALEDDGTSLIWGDARIHVDGDALSVSPRVPAPHACGAQYRRKH
jgi:hypothetical protein